MEESLCSIIENSQFDSKDQLNNEIIDKKLALDQNDKKNKIWSIGPDNLSPNLLFDCTNGV